MVLIVKIVILTFMAKLAFSGRETFLYFFIYYKAVQENIKTRKRQTKSRAKKVAEIRSYTIGKKWCALCFGRHKIIHYNYRHDKDNHWMTPKRYKNHLTSKLHKDNERQLRIQKGLKNGTISIEQSIRMARGEEASKTTKKGYHYCRLCKKHFKIANKAIHYESDRHQKNYDSAIWKKIKKDERKNKGRK